jgi:hypothetical protein
MIGMTIHKNGNNVLMEGWAVLTILVFYVLFLTVWVMMLHGAVTMERNMTIPPVVLPETD